MNIIKRLIHKFNREYKEKILFPFKLKEKQKIFCIGRNKTGTTSLKKAFEDLGFILGNQRKAEKLLPYYKNAEIQKIVEYCHTAQVFQDFPFSYPGTFKHLDKAYPNSKFILTVRDSPDQWYNSVVKYHSKLFGNGQVPTKQDLQNAPYVWKGWIWECNRLMYNTPEADLYNKERLVGSYSRYNQSVMDYFKDRPEDLLIINIAEKDSYNKLMKFLNINSPHSDFPWENKTTNIIAK